KLSVYRLQLALSVSGRYAGLESAHHEEVVTVARFQPITTRLNLVRHHQGNKQLGRVGHLRPIETAGSDSDYRKSVAVEFYSLAYYAGIRSKAFLPAA